MQVIFPGIARRRGYFFGILQENRDFMHFYRFPYCIFDVNGI